MAVTIHVYGTTQNGEAWPPILSHSVMLSPRVPAMKHNTYYCDILTPSTFNLSSISGEIIFVKDTLSSPSKVLVCHMVRGATSDPVAGFTHSIDQAHDPHPSIEANIYFLSLAARSVEPLYKLVPRLLPTTNCAAVGEVVDILDQRL